jgi:hypothetical protein
LSNLLNNFEVITHPFIIGELACGNLVKRSSTLDLLLEIPKAVTAEHEEVLKMLEHHSLFEIGIGWVDAHLLASSLLPNALIWTIDKRLATTAEKLNISFSRGK